MPSRDPLEFSSYRDPWTTLNSSLDPQQVQKALKFILPFPSLDSSEYEIIESLKKRCIEQWPSEGNEIQNLCSQILLHRPPITMEILKKANSECRTPKERFDFICKYKDRFSSIDPRSVSSFDMEALFHDIKNIGIPPAYYDPEREWWGPNQTLRDAALLVEIIRAFEKMPPCSDLPMSAIPRCQRELDRSPPSCSRIVTVLFSYLQRARDENSSIEGADLDNLILFIYTLEKHVKSREDLSKEEKNFIHVFSEELLSILPPREIAYRRFNQTMYCGFNTSEEIAAQKFEEGSKEAVQEGVRKLTEENASFDSLLQTFIQRRKIIAREQQDNSCFEKRTDPVGTPLALEYLEHAKKLYHSFYHNPTHQKSFEEEINERTYRLSINDPNPGYPSSYASLQLKGSPPVPMTSYGISHLREDRLSFSYCSRTLARFPKFIGIQHTDPKNIKFVLETAQFYFGRAKESSDEESFLENMALFRFYFAHACPTTRGSAAIGEWFEQSLALAKFNKELRYGKRDEFEMSNADLDAFISSTPSEYINLYKRQAKLVDPDPFYHTTP